MSWFKNFKERRAKWKYIKAGATIEEQLIRRFEMYGTAGFNYFPSQVQPPVVQIRKDASRFKPPRDYEDKSHLSGPYH